VRQQRRGRGEPIYQLLAAAKTLLGAAWLHMPCCRQAGASVAAAVVADKGSDMMELSRCSCVWCTSPLQQQMRGLVRGGCGQKDGHACQHVVVDMTVWLYAWGVLCACCCLLAPLGV
jgi:hypothetical protein